MKEKDEVHFEGKIAQKVIVVRGGKILLVQDPREKNDIWELPGGRMNIDENPKEAIKREFFEEMGVSIEIGEVVHMEQFIQGNENSRAFVIVYTALLLDGDADFNLADDEVSEFAWFSKEEILNVRLYPEYERALQGYFKKENI